MKRRNSHWFVNRNIQIFESNGQKEKPIKMKKKIHKNKNAAANSNQIETNKWTERKEWWCTYRNLRHTLDNKNAITFWFRKKNNQSIHCVLSIELLTCIGSLCGGRLVCRLVVARSLCIVCGSCCCRCNRIARLLLRWIWWSSCGRTKSQKHAILIRFQQKANTKNEILNCIAIDFEWRFFFFTYSHVGVQISIESRRHYNGIEICHMLNWCEPGELTKFPRIFGIAPSRIDGSIFLAKYDSRFSIELLTRIAFHHE